MSRAARMTKRDAVAVVLAALPDAPAVFTTGYAARLAPDRATALPLTGSMGLALPVAIGVAAASGRTTVALDGDGALLMNPAGLVTLGDYPGLPLLHVVLDDGIYASTGGQPSPGEHVDLLALARSCGVRAHEAETPEALTALLAELVPALAAHGGPAFVRVPVAPDAIPPAPRVTTPLPELAARFTRALAPETRATLALTRAARAGRPG